MKKLLYLLVATILTGQLIFPAYASGSNYELAQNNLSGSTYITDTERSINQLSDEVSRLRDEDYQRAIKSADDAGIKADRVLNYLVGIATVSGIVFAAFAFMVGGDVVKMRRTIKLSVDEVQKITKTTRAESEKLKEQVVEVAKTKDELSVILTTAKDEKEEQKKLIEDKTKAFDTALSKAMGTISNIGALGTSANFISLASGATGPAGPLGGAGTIGGLGPTWPTVSLDPAEVRCKYCKRFISFAGTYSNMEEYLRSVDAVCDSCRAQGLS